MMIYKKVSYRLAHQNNYLHFLAFEIQLPAKQTLIPSHLGTLLGSHRDGPEIDFGSHERIPCPPIKANPSSQEYSAINSVEVLSTITLPLTGAVNSSHCSEIIHYENMV